MCFLIQFLLLITGALVAAAKGEVAIRNGGFDISDPKGIPPGWSVSTWSKDGSREGLTASIDDRIFKEGGHSLHIAIHSNRSPAQVVCLQDVPVKPWSSYELVYQVRLVCPTSSTIQNYSFLAQLDAKQKELPTGPTFYVTTGKETAEWQQLRWTLETGERTRFLKLIFGLKAAVSNEYGDIWFDSVALRRLGPAANAATNVPTDQIAPQHPDGLISGAPEPGSREYELLYGHPSLGNVVANYSFELARTNLTPQLQPAYKSLADNQPVEWQSNGRGQWMRATAGHSGQYGLSVQNSAPDFSLQSRSLIAVDETKPYRLTAWVKAEGLNQAAAIAIIWLRVYHDTSGLHVDELGQSWSPPIAGTTDWRQVTVIGRPPPTAQFALARIMADTGAEGQLWLDDVIFEGLGDRDMELLYSQAGYERRGYKDVLVRAKQRFTEPGRLLVYPVETGESVMNRELIYQGEDAWGRHYWTAIFSELTNSGSYYMAAKFGEYRQTSSAPFPIRDGRYAELLRFGARWFYFQRSNYPVRGWHEADFLDDAMLFDPATHKEIGHADLKGGWHDAADMNKWSGYEATYMYQLVQSARVVKDTSREFLGHPQFPDMLAEAAWGATYLTNAYHAYNNPGYFAIWVKRGQNIPGTGKPTHGRRCDGDVFLPEALPALAAYANASKPFAPGEAAAAVAIAREIFPTYDQFYADFPLETKYALVTLGALELYRWTHEQIYLDAAKRRVSRTASACLAEDFLETVEQEFAKSIDIAFVFADSLEQFLAEHPEASEAGECRAALERFYQHLALLSRGPLGHTYFWTANADKARYYPSPARQLPYLLLCAMHLARGSHLFNRPEWLIVAEKNLQHVWGRNYAGISQMAYVGPYWASHYTELQVIPGHADGAMPGAVNKGHGIGRGVFWGAGNTRDACMPFGFPHAIVSTPYPTPHQTANNEVWGICNGNFIMAAAAVIESIEGQPEKQGENIKE